MLTSEVSVGLVESVRLTSTVSNGGGREKGEGPWNREERKGMAEVQ